MKARRGAMWAVSLATLGFVASADYANAVIVNDPILYPGDVNDDRIEPLVQMESEGVCDPTVPPDWHWIVHWLENVFSTERQARADSRAESKRSSK